MGTKVFNSTYRFFVTVSKSSSTKRVVSSKLNCDYVLSRCIQNNCGSSGAASLCDSTSWNSYHDQHTRYRKNCLLLTSGRYHIDLTYYCKHGYSTTPDSKKVEGDDKSSKLNAMTEPHGDEVKLTLFQKFKKMYKEYWYVLIPVHIATSIIWYGSFYYALHSGVDLVSFLERLGAGETITKPLKNSSAGYFALAYAMYKIATPARYTVTLGGTTLSINYLRRIGVIKPMPSTKQMQQIWKDKKVEMKEKKEQAIETWKKKKTWRKRRKSL